ncbi:transmembrane and immunoglobulin domain-containing protein 1 isoform X2 [Denticeps clupeoides]|uniref:transmembrane and immunoglobulin domain-containing protein 1 isoform X2 n=1 Tax=Denticeps clupeoides TaxID=299321 RepID=UPI0010A369E4|nr:transmembrane and immunoglobulin domain-containing protein 1-like isoform X2 [Denticeps clupeoides]
MNMKEPERLFLITLLFCWVDETAGGELQWFRNKALVDLKEGNREERSHLCVWPVTREDNGAIFRCQLKNDASVNSSVQLEVLYAPQLNGTEQVSVKEESEAELSCDSRANPPVTVVWRFEGRMLDLSSGGYIATNNGVTARLTIPKVIRANHQGLYTCVLDSDIYGQRMKSFQLSVDDKTMKFPLEAIIAGLVVVLCTAALAVVSRWKRIVKCCK